MDAGKMDKPKSYQEAWDAFEVNQLELKELHDKLETARKYFPRYGKHDEDCKSPCSCGLDAILDQIGAGRFDRKCPHCDFVTEYPLMFENHVKYGHGAGQKGGK